MSLLRWVMPAQAGSAGGLTALSMRQAFSAQGDGAGCPSCNQVKAAFAGFVVKMKIHPRVSRAVSADALLRGLHGAVGYIPARQVRAPAPPPSHARLIDASGLRQRHERIAQAVHAQGVDISGLSQLQLSAIAGQLKGRPRETLAFKTPAEMFSTMTTRREPDPPRPVAQGRSRRVRPADTPGGMRRLRFNRRANCRARDLHGHKSTLKQFASCVMSRYDR